MKKYIVILSIIFAFSNILVVHAKEEKQLLSRFITGYNEENIERSINISLATSAINGYRVLAKSEVSFNAMTGERTIAKGYKNAKVIFNGEYTLGIGGGVCQVSTTLYNALLLADILVLEVHAHTIKPTYIAASMDAMVSFHTHDLVFKNNTDADIIIYASAKHGSLTVDIYGSKVKTDITYKSEVTRLLTPIEPRIVYDTEGMFEHKVIFKQESYTHIYPQNGMESRLIVIRANQQVIIREDVYSPVQGVIIRGTL